MQARSTSAVDDGFPFRSETLCYIEVGNDGSVTFGDVAGAYGRARSGDSRLFVAWPGQWRTDLFVVDDLDELARAFGYIHDEQRTGLADHHHELTWSISPFESKPTATYVSIEVRFQCGCAIRDITVFARQMRDQRGWNVATTAGYGASSDQFSVRVQRRTLA